MNAAIIVMTARCRQRGDCVYPDWFWWLLGGCSVVLTVLLVVLIIMGIAMFKDRKKR